MATKKRKVKQSMKEFRAWLQGVEELQPDDWSPTKDQWKLIREKINGIIEEVKIIEKNVEAPRSAPRAYPPYQTPPQGIVNAPHLNGVPLGEVVMTEAAQQLLSPPTGKSKTPDIDTSDGNVASPFA